MFDYHAHEWKGKISWKHFEHVYEQIIKPAVESEGYEAYRVDDDKISNSIIAKIFKAAQTCPMAVCDLSDQNPNVLYELGLRQAYDKPVVLIKDDITKEIIWMFLELIRWNIEATELMKM